MRSCAAFTAVYVCRCLNSCCIASSSALCAAVNLMFSGLTPAELRVVHLALRETLDHAGLQHRQRELARTREAESFALPAHAVGPNARCCVPCRPASPRCSCWDCWPTSLLRPALFVRAPLDLPRRLSILASSALVGSSLACSGSSCFSSASICSSNFINCLVFRIVHHLLRHGAHRADLLQCRQRQGTRQAPFVGLGLGEEWHGRRGG